VTGTTGFIQRRHRRLLARFEMNDEVVSDFGMADANKLRMVHDSELSYVYYKEDT
jgi:hypothetical protein